jgi:outer membrane protein assembly factor BamA
VSLGAATKALGSQYDVWSVSWSWDEFFPLWWRRHVFTFQLSGGAAGGDIARRGVYFLGGYAPQPDPLRSVFDFTRAGGASLRGYPFGSVYGDQFHVLNLEYRFPLVDIERGWATLPLYARRLHGAVFTDVGNAFYGPFEVGALKVGVGAELRLDFLIAHDFGAALQLGYARGLTAGGQDQVYFFVNNPF